MTSPSPAAIVRGLRVAGWATFWVNSPMSTVVPSVTPIPMETLVSAIRVGCAPPSLSELKCLMRVVIASSPSRTGPISRGCPRPTTRGAWSRTFRTSISTPSIISMRTSFRCSPQQRVSTDRSPPPFLTSSGCPACSRTSMSTHRLRSRSSLPSKRGATTGLIRSTLRLITRVRIAIPISSCLTSSS